MYLTLSQGNKISTNEFYALIMFLANKYITPGWFQGSGGAVAKDGGSKNLKFEILQA